MLEIDDEDSIPGNPRPVQEEVHDGRHMMEEECMHTSRRWTYEVCLGTVGVDDVVMKRTTFVADYG